MRVTPDDLYTSHKEMLVELLMFDIPFPPLSDVGAIVVLLAAAVLLVYFVIWPLLRAVIDHWDEEAVQEYIQLMAVTIGWQRPNTAQRNLIQDVDNGLVMLQGPPGTGKTKFTVAPTLLSRGYAAINHDNHSAVSSPLSPTPPSTKHLKALSTSPPIAHREPVRTTSCSSG